MLRPLLACCLLLPTLAAAEGVTVEGRVFEDRNANMRFDAGEPGIAGAKVSDGRQIVVSDGQGRYRLTTGSGRSVFVIKPPAYRFLLWSDSGLPRMWEHAIANDPAARAGRSSDFPLVRESKPSTAFEALLFADSQPKSAVDVGYYDRDIVEPIIGGYDASFGLTLGDIVNDVPSLFGEVAKTNARLSTPWFYIPGNHDVDASAQGDDDSLQGFHRAFGPDTFALEEGQASFVGLDDVIARPGQSPVYIGGLREDQFAFLENYLRDLPRDRLVVIGVHIPFFDPIPGKETFRRADRERLFALLRPFPHVLLLSGHTHQQRHYFHAAATGWQGGQPLHEYNVGAACGGFWAGAKDAQGIPASTMSDGTPNGYAVLKVNGSDYSLHWYAARAPADYQIALHAPKVLRKGAFPAFGVYANVFMGQADTKVEYRIDGGDWKPMNRIEQPDPDLLAENAIDDGADRLRGYDRSVEAAPSTHLWRGGLTTDLALGEHRIEVRADLPDGSYTAQTGYRLDEAQP